MGRRVNSMLLDAMDVVAGRVAEELASQLLDYPRPVALALAWRAVALWIEAASDDYGEEAEDLVAAMVKRARVREGRSLDEAVVVSMPPPGGEQ